MPRWTAVGALRAGLLLALVCWAGPAAAAPAELEFAKGVVAYSQGRLEEAEARFSAVLAQQPDNVQAQAYLGQVALARGEVARAIELLGRVVERAPDQAGVRLDLALALVKAGRLEEAESQLARASTELDERASVHFYLGTCRYRLGRLQEALAPLRRAQQLDGGFAAAAGYYLGLVLYRLGEAAQAEAEFRALAGRGGEDWTAELARANLASLGRGGGDVSPARKRWGLFASAGFQYDSNVTLNREQASEADAAGAFLAAGVFGLPVAGEHDALELSASAYRSFYFEDTAADFALTDLSAVARYTHAFEAGHQLSLGYLFDLDLLDDRGALDPAGASDPGFGLFMHSHTGLVSARFAEGRAARTVLEYRFQAAFFFETGRDDFGHEAVLRQELGFLDGRLRLELEAGGLYEDARDRDWDLWGLLAGLELRGQPVEGLSLWARGGWRRENHHRFVAYTGGRVDDLVSAGVGLSWEVWDHISLGASYLFLDNLSTEFSQGPVQVADDPYSFLRHVVCLSVTGHM
ncbi:MAG TPA: tetratricopeptide repeat protein [Myxococcota bacterium]|nr:tetratricopeptide repeat protein [Myxococcota bacterium]HRY96361.1 tetratricopeptide repeat protein [Myxococcota bacterium]HSA20786.1 tetratricopeptide repeat protein [Myxococcota bacterium]